MRQEHLSRWKACNGCRQSKTLTSRAEELQAMSTPKIKVAVKLLAGYTKLRTHMFKLGFTQRQDCRLSRDKKVDGVHVVCQCPALACERCRTLGLNFLKLKI